MNAFRNAALIDPSFAYPEKAGSKGKALYDRARQAAEGQGKLMIGVEAPAKLKAGEGFTVKVDVPETPVPFFENVSIHVEDKPGNVTHTAEKPAEAKESFDVPAAAATPGRTLEVRIAVVDAQKNEWARGVARVAVALVPPPVAAPPPPIVEETSQEKPSFFAGKWPFIVGGAAALIAGVVIVGVVASSKSNIVTVNAPTWQTAAISR